MSSFCRRGSQGPGTLIHLGKKDITWNEGSNSKSMTFSNCPPRQAANNQFSHKVDYLPDIYQLKSSCKQKTPQS